MARSWWRKQKEKQETHQLSGGPELARSGIFRKQKPGPGQEKAAARGTGGQGKLQEET